MTKKITQKVPKYLYKIFLMILFFTAGNSLYAGNLYNYTGGTWEFVDNVAQWNALFSVGAVQANDEYVIPVTATIVIGSTGASHNVDLNAVRKDITVNGRLGFRSAGTQQIRLHPTAVITVNAGGAVGFEQLSLPNIGNWFGNLSEHIVFGPNLSSPYMNGPFYILGPESLDISDAAPSPGAPSPVSRIWTGSISTDWSTPGNWAVVPSGVTGVSPTPSASDFVTIPSTLNSPEVQSGAVVIHDLRVEPTSNLTVSTALTVTGNISNGGDIVVTNGAALVQTVGSTLQNTGNFLIDRDLSGETSPWYMGSPINTLSKSGFSSCGNAQFVPGTTCANPQLGGASLCVMSINEDNTTTGINCSHSLWNYESGGSFSNGKGYSFYRPSTLLTFTGTVNNGSVSYGSLGYSNKGAVLLPPAFGGSSTRGWHMVSNPYPSPISLSAAQRTAMGFEAQTQFWDSDLGTWVSPAPGSTITVAVAQAFQVRVAGGVGNTATFAVDNSNRVATVNATFYKTEENTDYLNITLNDGVNSNTASLNFVDGATDAFDAAYDANRLFGLVDRPYIYTIEQNGEFLAYNALPLLTQGETKSVPLSLHVGINGNCTITFNGINVANATVMLKDLTTGNMYSVTEGYVHTFAAQTTDNPNRFVLHFNASAVSSIANVLENRVTMFPNPTAGRATIMMEANHGFSELQVLDINGKLVVSDRIAANENNKSFDIRNLASGVYTVKLNGNNTITKKMIKQ